MEYSAQYLARVLFLMSLLTIPVIEGEWCNETITETKQRIVHYTVQVAKKRTNGFCAFFRRARRCNYVEDVPAQRIENYEETVIVPKCCNGFSIDGLRCHPICDPSCVNGICTAPNKCECLVDFMRPRNQTNPLSHHVCEECDCPNGFCAGGLCECSPGYYRELVLDHCEPECNVDCASGRCSSPNICEQVIDELSTTTEESTEIPSTTTEAEDIRDPEETASTTTDVLYTSTSSAAESESSTYAETTTGTTLPNIVEIATDSEKDLNEEVGGSTKAEETITSMEPEETFTDDPIMKTPESETFLYLWSIVCLFVLVLLVGIFILYEKLSGKSYFLKHKENSVHFTNQLMSDYSLDDEL